MTALERGLRSYIEAETRRLDHFVLNMHAMPASIRPTVAAIATAQMSALNAVESQIDRLTSPSPKED